MCSIIKSLKSECPHCGAKDVFYKLSHKVCCYCEQSLEYNEYCTCIKTDNTNCDNCEYNNLEGSNDK